MTARETLLSVRDLRVSFATDEGVVRAVDGLSYEVARGEVFAIVGESGSGKSVGALSLLGLLETPPARVVATSVTWKGDDLLGADAATLRRIRGNEIAMVFQDPLSALNPVHKVGRQIAEVVRAHTDIGRAAARRRAVEMLGLVGIPQPERRVDSYPHEFSGGMRQRVMIAMALALDPDLLIADEPTTALDVTVQAQVLELMVKLKEELDSAILLITHDLGVVAGMADRVMVMYAGRQAELATVDELFARPSHPYTRGLLESLPRLDDVGDEPLVPIRGAPPSLVRVPPGCPFHPRCDFATRGRCNLETPPAVPMGPTGHLSVCHHADRVATVDHATPQST